MKHSNAFEDDFGMKTFHTPRKDIVDDMRVSQYIRTYSASAYLHYAHVQSFMRMRESAQIFRIKQADQLVSTAETSSQLGFVQLECTLLYQRDDYVVSICHMAADSNVKSSKRAGSIPIG